MPPLHPKAQLEHIHFHELASTQDAAKLSVAQDRLDLPRLFTASIQTQGVGQQGRAWRSPLGGFWGTFTVQLSAASLEPRALETLGLRVGIGVLQSILATLPAHARNRIKLKLPNDIVIVPPSESHIPPLSNCHGKVGGILCDIVQRPPKLGGKSFAVVGIGINAAFPRSHLPPPENFEYPVTTLQELLNIPFNLEALISELKQRIVKCVDRSTLTNANVDFLHDHLFELNKVQEVRGVEIQPSHPTPTPPNATHLGKLVGISTRACALLEDHPSGKTKVISNPKQSWPRV